MLGDEHHASLTTLIEEDLWLVFPMLKISGKMFMSRAIARGAQASARSVDKLWRELPKNLVAFNDCNLCTSPHC